MTISATDDLIDGYGVDGSSRGRATDELVSQNGEVRAHWAPLLDGYRSLGLDELSRRHDEITLLLEQEGVTYNRAAATGDGDPSRPRPWSLDPIPLVVAEDEWQVLERGIQQRAELLDAILTDLYGPRRLLHDRIVAPSMILGDPQYLRAWAGVTIPGPRQLPLVGFDLHRGPDGSWRALSNRAQAPSGMAYAIENRRVLARVFPTLFRSTGVRRLGPFIQALRAAMVAAAPPAVDNPTVVVLSPGSLSETAYEHGAIATRLGYPLVEGSDLRLRDGRVWLETISDLVPVDIILRRVDALYCDPLELKPESTLGLPGLVDACRTGTVSVLNPIGAGVLENAGLLSILPEVARALLGTDLLLPGTESWWCGDDAGRSHVLANLGRLVVRPLSRASLTHSVDTALADRAELDELRRRIEADPEQWVGQERIEPATSPILAGGQFTPRATVLRTFAVADESGYLVLPGGLARTAADDVDGPITNRSGAVSKDTWVLGRDHRSVNETSPIRIAGASANVGSTAARAAENLFWLGRYAERAEATVRLLRAVEQRRGDTQVDGIGPDAQALRDLLVATTRITGTWPGFVGDDAAARLSDPAAELVSVIVDRSRPGTVAHAVEHLFAAMGVVRDQLSVDTWLVVGSLQRLIDAYDGSRTGRLNPENDTDEATFGLLDGLLHGLLSLSGLATESMIRDQGWHFMDAGRRIERSLHVAVLLADVLGPDRPRATEGLLIESVAGATESIITYRRRDRGQTRVAALIELLLADAGNPRSVRFQLDRLNDDLAFLRASRPATNTLSATPLILEATRRIDDLSVSQLAEIGPSGHRDDLIELVAQLRDLLTRASNGIASDYFVHQLPQRSVQTPVEVPARRP